MAEGSAWCAASGSRACRSSRSTAMAPALHSRFARHVVMPELSGPSFVEGLLRLGSTPVLFLTTDEAVLTVSEHRAALETCYRIRLPSHDSLVALSRKSAFQELAERNGFAVPRSIYLRAMSDVASLVRLRFPLVIKPSVKTAHYLARQFERCYRVASIAEAQAVCRDVMPVLPDLVAQEWIEGADTALYFCLQYRGAGGAIASFTGRKLSIWPPDVGATASCIAAPEAHGELQRLTDAFFAAVAFTGMGGIEYKRDARSGKFLMIEPTVGRVDWQGGGRDAQRHQHPARRLPARDRFRCAVRDSRDAADNLARHGAALEIEQSTQRRREGARVRCILAARRSPAGAGARLQPWYAGFAARAAPCRAAIVREGAGKGLSTQAERRENGRIELARCVVGHQPHSVEQVPERPRHPGGLAGLAHVADVARDRRQAPPHSARRLRSAPNSPSRMWLRSIPCRAAHAVTRAKMFLDEATVRPRIEILRQHALDRRHDRAFLAVRRRVVSGHARRGGGKGSLASIRRRTATAPH
jgi:hypothetical protein